MGDGEGKGQCEWEDDLGYESYYFIYSINTH